MVRGGDSRLPLIILQPHALFFLCHGPQAETNPLLRFVHLDDLEIPSPRSPEEAVRLLPWDVSPTPPDFASCGIIPPRPEAIPRIPQIAPPGTPSRAQCRPSDAFGRTSPMRPAAAVSCRAKAGGFPASMFSMTACTIWPFFTISDGCFTRTVHDMSEICTSPSTPSSISINAPKSDKLPDSAFYHRADAVALGDRGPGIGLQLFDPKRDAPLFGLHFKHHRFHLVAHFDHLCRDASCGGSRSFRKYESGLRRRPQAQRKRRNPSR